MDECEEGRHRCPGECKNTDGSYECVCPKGYVINAAKTKCIGEFTRCSLIVGVLDRERCCVNIEINFCVCS